MYNYFQAGIRPDTEKPRKHLKDLYIVVASPLVCPSVAWYKDNEQYWSPDIQVIYSGANSCF